MAERHVGFSTLERLEAIIANPALFELAEAVPERDPTAGGRPRHYPVFLWLLFDALLSVYGSGRKVEAELAHPAVWSRVRQHVRDAQPHRPDLWLPERPMRRHHYLYGRTRYLVAPAVLEQLADIHRETASRQAVTTGLLDPSGPGSWTHPDLSRMLYADGKVITPLFRAKPGDKRIDVGSSRVDLQACKLEYSIVSPK